MLFVLFCWRLSLCLKDIFYHLRHPPPILPFICPVNTIILASGNFLVYLKLHSHCCGFLVKVLPPSQFYAVNEKQFCYHSDLLELLLLSVNCTIYNKNSAHSLCGPQTSTTNFSTATSSIFCLFVVGFPCIVDPSFFFILFSQSQTESHESFSKMLNCVA